MSMSRSRTNGMQQCCRCGWYAHHSSKYVRAGTCGSVLPDGTLNIALGMDIETGYVAVTRFQHADDVLILEPFELSDFQRGRRLETDIYMAHCQSGFKGLNDPTVKAMIDEYTLSKKPKQPKRTRNTVEESGIPGFVLGKCAKCNTVMPMLQKRMHQATQKRQCLKCSPKDYPPSYKQSTVYD